MGMFTVIPKDTFDALQLDAGVLLKTFDPANVAAPADEDIICATTGGITVSATPTFTDLGEDIDNCPNNMKENKHLDSWECALGGTALSTSPYGIALALGAAAIDSTDGSKVTLDSPGIVATARFQDIWWVGDRADGGCVAVNLKNAMSTSGFSLQTTKNGKGQTAFTLTGHVSINAQKEMPMVFYSIDPAADASTDTDTYTSPDTNAEG